MIVENPSGVKWVVSFKQNGLQYNVVSSSKKLAIEEALCYYFYHVYGNKETQIAVTLCHN